jgi:hypothetical protein
MLLRWTAGVNLLERTETVSSVIAQSGIACIIAETAVPG